MADTSEASSVDAVAAEFDALSKEFAKFEEMHKSYLQLLDQEASSQGKCMKDLSHLKYRLNQISDSLKTKPVKSLSPVEAKQVEDLKSAIVSRKSQLSDLRETYPGKANIYLRTILGNVNLSLPGKADRFRYKDEYEHFKLVITMISTVWSFCNLFLFRYRVMDAAFHFLLVWYYCTLTIREGILRLNGSKIQTWWVAHHYISTFLTGIMVTWPESVTWQAFRTQFYVFCLYLGLVQVLQYRYQHGQLYKLKALGARGSMDITVEGFHSWMWRGLGFLLPFLFGGYFFQFYNAYTLWNLSRDPTCTEWQVLWSGAIFFILFLGNTLTTCSVIYNKFHRPATSKSESARLEAKYKSS